MTSTLRSKISQYCGSRASQIQIMVTETNSVSYNTGKQTVSLVNALFLADNYMTWLENGVTNVDWWDLHNGASGGNNNSASLYGNAQYGDYGLLSNGTCTNTTSNICEPAANTPFPSYYGLQMLSNLGTPGDTIVSAASNQSLVAAHAVKQANGNLAVLLINKDPSNSYTVSLALNGYNAASNATIYTYGEQSNSITSTSGSSSSVTIAPYSLTTVVLQPGGVGTPTPTPTSTPTATPTSTPVNTSACKVSYSVNQWPGGFTGNVTVTNTGSSTINGWTLTFSFPGNQQVTQSWNGVYSQQGNAVSIKNADYNASIAAGTSVNPGFNASWSGSNPSPTSFALNGTTCSAG
ncbi:cellulose-binding domain-containing protein [Dictyobacter kobayashii]|uniref:CBM2 domain-containing protein n=1 Tax=Dictyobacter kobayashii TaxID=2014872 RepID=A0A402AZ94_9CHLR|nr:cellulose-binding domain-containing protein [Dictyobacter kobayashii]GCE24444.1 hypothetical protein KDK_82440 [Dictyobacter kobayashii]